MANLLIVDDELGMRQFLTHLFQREGHTVRAAASAREAIEFLGSIPADLIVSDVRMPDMNGIELLRAARELLPNVEVIAAKQANPVALVRYPAVLLTKGALARLEEMFK